VKVNCFTFHNILQLSQKDRDIYWALNRCFGCGKGGHRSERCPSWSDGKIPFCKLLPDPYSEWSGCHLPKGLVFDLFIVFDDGFPRLEESSDSESIPDLIEVGWDSSDLSTSLSSGWGSTDLLEGPSSLASSRVPLLRKEYFPLPVARFMTNCRAAYERLEDRQLHKELHQEVVDRDTKGWESVEELVGLSPLGSVENPIVVDAE
jgi:hypothetical protein